MLPRLSTLQIALLVSVLAHAALLALRIADPEGFRRAFEDTPLEVILVNGRTSERPAEAKLIAQANLTGGGEANQGRATSPLPPTQEFQLGDASNDARKQLEAMQVAQMQLLATVRQELATMPPPDPKREGGKPQDSAQEDRRRQLLRVLGEIEKRINEENARPRKRYISPATKEEVYAVYYDGLRRKIEDRGTHNFPEFQGKKLYGELTMNITIDAQGRVAITEILRSSGSKQLDRRAMAIVRAAAPFGPFNTDMLRAADQLVITSRFRFTREDGLETTLSTRP